MPTDDDSVRQTHAYPFTDEDVYLFRAGRHCRLYEKFGAHVRVVDGQEGVSFAVWAPNAASVAVIGDFNGWSGASHALVPSGDGAGIWYGFFPDVHAGSLYKYRIHSRHNGYIVDNADTVSVQLINEILAIGRSSIARRRGKITRHLIAP